MRASVLAIGLALILAGQAAAQGGEKHSDEDIRKAEASLRHELRGPLMVYIIDAPREPFLRGVEFDRIVLLVGRPFYRFRATTGEGYWVLDPSRIFAFASDSPPPKK